MLANSKLTRPSKKYVRTIEGLRDALFDELEDLRNGASTAHEATAFSKLAAQIIGSIEVEMKQVAARRESLIDHRRIAALIESSRDEDAE